MAKNKLIKVSWAVGAAFVAFTAAVALGWLYGADLWALEATQRYSSGLLDSVLSAFSFLGGAEIAGVILLVLLAWLMWRGRWRLAGRILIAFVATGILELAIKFYLPQVPLPEGIARAEDYAPVVAVDSPYPYPSGHVLRTVIIFGALCLLSRNWFLRAGLLIVLIGIGVSRFYAGVHWASDAVGGALLGVAALSWAFGKEDLKRR
jgi:undecaprenyl-diphosphatase